MRQTFTLVAIAAAFIGLLAHRVARYHPSDLERMPLPLAENAERQLHLVPGGKYTQSDIAANGHTIPSHRYSGFQAQHDPRPRPGDLLCPITRTKANRSCTWTINGQVYAFCCPPCIDEFVRLAKTESSTVEPAAAYVQQ